VRGEEARVEHGGASAWLRVGAAQVRLATGPVRSGAREIVIPMGQGGHFFVDGAINGRAVRFMVDTGATTIAMGAAEAQRLGIDYQKGQRGFVGTAGGVVAAYGVNLGAVRVGEIEVPNVQATVSAAGMPFVLLGNSFLNRFQMRRENDVLRLEMR
jgi:aspartyl protease family protein